MNSLNFLTLLPMLFRLSIGMFFKEKSGFMSCYDPQFFNSSITSQTLIGCASRCKMFGCVAFDYTNGKCFSDRYSDDPIVLGIGYFRGIRYPECLTFQYSNSVLAHFLVAGHHFSFQIWNLAHAMLLQ